MSLHITFTTLGPEAMDKMLKDAMSKESIRQLPLHKRKKARQEQEEEEEDEDDKYADEDRKARADLVETTRPGNAPEITPDDLPAAVLPKKKPSYVKKSDKPKKK